MVALFTLVGANGFTITPTLILGLTVIGLLMLVAWWYFIMREKPKAQATGRGRLALGRSAINKKLNPIAPRLSPIPVNLPRLNQRRIRPAPEPTRFQSEQVDLSDNIASTALGSGKYGSVAVRRDLLAARGTLPF